MQPSSRMPVHEQKFLDALRDIFVGAEIEGEGGFINLMKIKSRYYTEGVGPKLLDLIAEELKPFPEFREELFDKLYTFFKRYFSESGSIYFRHTPYSEDIYEKVYTDDRDVMLFWKTQNLYYVKTDRLFRSMKISLENEEQTTLFFDADAVAKQTFDFDASSLETKKNNEKRSLIFEYKGRSKKDEILEFRVLYSEGGKKTKVDEILRAIKKDGIKVTEEQLTKAFRLFERQTEVDFFINKNARAFLTEQFDLWMYQYIFKHETEFREKRIRQLQVLKKIAYSIVDFISQFEDELVRIWNKPKFVRSSGYIITLDRIREKSEEMAKKFVHHPGFKAQVGEWKELGIISAGIKAEELFAKEKYRYLPFDTKHFKSLEAELVSIFDNLDEDLDGRIIHSDNYQALSTVSRKFDQRFDCIHVDPPYNTATTGFEYVNTYQHSSWLSMMANRLEKAQQLLSPSGSFQCHIDENEYERLFLLVDEAGLEDAGTVIWDKKHPMLGRKGVATQHEYVLWRSKRSDPFYLTTTSVKELMEAAAHAIRKFGGVNDQARREFSSWISKNDALSGGEKAYNHLDEDGRIYQSVSLSAPELRADPKFHEPLLHPVTGKPCPVPPNGFSRTPENLRILIEQGEIIFGKDEKTQPRKKIYLSEASRRQITSIISDGRKGKTDLDALGLVFPYSHPVGLYEQLIGGATDKGSTVADYFAGSGTTAHAVINLNKDGGRRRYVLIEANDYLRTIILPRLKKVVFCDTWASASPQDSGTGSSHFCKYFSFEQYEDALRRAVYVDDKDSPGLPMYGDPYETPFTTYVFLRDPKMSDALNLDYDANKVRVDFANLYDDIDWAETLSCIKGKFIKSQTADSVTFADGETIKFDDIDYKDILPLIWWDK